MDIIVVTLASVAEAITDWPRWKLMWLLAFAIFAACKLITWRAAKVPNARARRPLAYLLAWPGLDANRFLDPQCRPNEPAIREWISAVFQLVLGAAIFWNAQYSFFAASPILLGWAGMVGVVLILHFGIFKLMSCAWRMVGVDARPLMVAPLAATSITEFWGKRWNTAFRDFAHEMLFHPLARRCGVSKALFLTFVFSGLIHDVVISLPAGAGYGGPAAFFVIQLVAMAIERSRLGRELGLGRGRHGWLFTATVLIVPAALLFHAYFIHAVVIPFMRALGAA